MQVLVTSPIPSHPQNHGNRARVYSLCRTLQKRGYKVHFVYGGLEGLAPDQELAMRQTWDFVHVVPHKPGKRKQSKRSHHLIDDWYVTEVDEITARILRIWKIDYCLANYVWFSRWLEQVPEGIPKYLDTHDMFAHRHKKLKKAGLEATWYSTTPAEEAKAFNRADRVFAIQASEADTFRRATQKPVDTVGHYLPPQFISPKAAATGAKLKVGYMASNNPINLHSLQQFNKALKTKPALLDKVDLYLAGAICTSDEAMESAFEKLGFVDSVEDFFASMDVILNPNIGGTGLKIKSIDALSYGMPLLATSDAMIGIPTAETLHQCATLESLLDGLLALADDRTLLTPLREAGQKTYLAYANDQLETLDRLFPCASGGADGKAAQT